MTTRLYQKILHTVKREPLRSLSFPQPSSKNHFPTNDRAAFNFKTNISLQKRNQEKGHYRIIDFGKELNHGFGKLEPNEFWSTCQEKAFGDRYSG